ncbi:hypothetical protein IIA79_06845 [bacterium]|nr:hypothetical protein [bacterium]
MTVMSSHLEGERFLLYVDILGFRDLVQSNETRAVYMLLDQLLAQCEESKFLLKGFRTLYFSDTVLIYKESREFLERELLDICFIASKLWCALAANNIPCRGALAYGDFHAEMNSSGEHIVFCGKALVEAHDITEGTKLGNDWIGIRVCPSVLEVLEEDENRLLMEGIDDEFYVYGPMFVVDENNEVLLNSLDVINREYGYYVRQGYELFDECLGFVEALEALDFILRKASEVAINCQIEDYVQRKYEFTLKTIRTMLSDRVIQWARLVCDHFRYPLFPFNPGEFEEGI